MLYSSLAAYSRTRALSARAAPFVARPTSAPLYDNGSSAAAESALATMKATVSWKVLRAA